MKKPTIACLIMFTALAAGCSTNKVSVVDAVEAGADPSKITPATAAGAPKVAAECDVNHPRPLWRQNRKLRSRMQYRKQKEKGCIE